MQHGLSLLKNDSDANRRLAMLAIDNAVELTIKTYLGLPKRVTKIELSRADFSTISESFPRLLDALEHHASDKVIGIDLGEIEWYHRLRNELYHQGNGLTVERDKVDVYAQLARVLFRNLFGIDLAVREDNRTDILGAFMESWVDLERVLSEIISFQSEQDLDISGRMRNPLSSLRLLESSGLMSRKTVLEIDELRRVRNQVVHGVGDYKTLVSPDLVQRTKKIALEVEKELENIRSASQKRSYREK